MSTVTREMTQRERELGAIISAYNQVTDSLKESHERLREQVARLREELARKNRQLRRRERLAALGEMAAGVAHEIRNPLGGIQLFASLLEKDLADRPEAQRLVRKISKGVARLEAIVTDILEFGRPCEPDPKPVRLDALLRETIELALSKVDQTGVAVEVAGELAGELADLEMVTDAGLLQRALLNLLVNALEAAAAAGGNAQQPAVQIGLRCVSADRVTLSVADNGPGVPAQYMDQIFNPFFTTKDKGTGLGLAIAHQIAETLGGTIQVANRSEGGAVFSLGLPRHLAHPSGHQAWRSRDGADLCS